MSRRLEGRVAMITGSGGGSLGREGALLFAREGARIAVLDVRADGVRETVRRIEAGGGEAVGIPTDVTAPAAVAAAVERTLEVFGRIDILWNNAAIMRSLYQPVEHISDDDWDAVITTNLTAYWLVIRCVVPHLKRQRSGVILNTVSISGLVAHRPGRAAYVAAKGGVIALTRQLALELGPFNVRVNCLAGGGGGVPGAGLPGVADAPAPESNPFGGLPFTGPETAMPRTEATRLPVPKEYAQAALFLVEGAAGPLTGVTLAHDGGRTTR